MLVSQKFPDFDKILHQNFFVGIDVRTTTLNQLLELVQRTPERSLPQIRSRYIFVAKLFTPFFQHFLYITESIQLTRTCGKLSIKIVQ